MGSAIPARGRQLPFHLRAGMAQAGRNGAGHGHEELVGNYMCEKQDSEVAIWIRHFDTLLWTATTILAAAIGGLYLFCLKENKYELALFGFLLTIIAVHFASSLRHHRQKVFEKYKDNTFFDAMKSREKCFYQCGHFLFIYLFSWEACGLRCYLNIGQSLCFYG